MTVSFITTWNVMEVRWSSSSEDEDGGNEYKDYEPQHLGQWQPDDNESYESDLDYDDMKHKDNTNLNNVDTAELFALAKSHKGNNNMQPTSNTSKSESTSVGFDLKELGLDIDYDMDEERSKDMRDNTSMKSRTKKFSLSENYGKKATRSTQSKIGFKSTSLTNRKKEKVIDSSSRGTFDWEGFAQLKQLNEQNLALLNQLDEKDKIINQLRVSSNMFHNGDTGHNSRIESKSQSVVMSGDDVRLEKIKEISKKNRQLTANLETERRKKRQLERTIRELNSEMSALQQAPQWTRQDSFKGSKPISKGASPSLKQGYNDSVKQRYQEESEGSEQQASLAIRLEKQNAKLLEFKRQHGEMKAEIRKLQHALLSEVGENIPINQIMADAKEGSSWKGRAEQISMLRKKVSSLNVQLEKISVAGNTASNSSRKCESTNFVSSGMAGTLSHVDKRHRDVLHKIEREKKNKLYTLEAEIASSQQEIASLKQKSSAASARTQVVTADLHRAKENISSLLKKAEIDDQLIAALKEELQKAMSSVFESNERVDDPKLVHKLKLLVADQDKRLLANNDIIRKLEDTIRSKKSEINQMRATIDELRAGIDGQEHPIAELHTTTSNRNVLMNLEEERGNVATLSVERDKMKELSEMLRRQLKDCNEQLDRSRKELTVQKQHSLQKERQLERMKCANSKRALSLSNNDEDMISELKNKVEILRASNESLKEALNASKSKHDEEMTIYHDLLAETKRAYVVTMKQMRTLSNQKKQQDDYNVRVNTVFSSTPTSRRSGSNVSSR